MDMITLAMAKAETDKLKKSGGAGYEESKHISYDLAKLGGEPDFTVMGVGFTCISPLTPTKEELAKGSIYLTVKRPGEEEKIGNDLIVTQVMFDDGVAYGGIFQSTGFLSFAATVAIAYRAGAWNGYEIPAAGVYLAMNVGDWDFELNPAWFNIKYETVKKIEPKFLPGVCLPVVELTTVPGTEPAALTDAEIATLEALGNMPCIFKFTDADSVCTLVANAFSFAENANIGGYFMYGMPGATYTVVNDGSGWVFVKMGES